MNPNVNEVKVNVLFVTLKIFPIYVKLFFGFNGTKEKLIIFTNARL